MAQSIYDDDAFFTEYSSLDRTVKGLDGAPEWPRLRNLLPHGGHVYGMDVLDLGCGFGGFSRWAMEKGEATSVRAIDNSQKMLSRARDMTNNESIHYELGDLDNLNLGDLRDAYEVVFSSLALHYVVNLENLVMDIRRVLIPGGLFVFSIEHPIYTAPSHPEFITNQDSGKKYWPLDNYQKEGIRETDWLAKGFKKQHRTMASYINVFLENGFEIKGFDEWYPTPEELEKYGWHGVLDRPVFLLMSVMKD